MKPDLRLTLLFAILFPLRASAAEEWTILQDLRGQWKIEMGDSSRWASPTHDDRRWEEIFVPSAWEDEGFPGYDGYAWYRKHFAGTSKLKADGIYLLLGNVDDVCEVYLNGTLVGYTGSFPPDYQTAYDVTVQIPVPASLFRASGDNVLAVRVYDRELSGGILRGRIGFFRRNDMLTPDVSLAGFWKFRTGDNRGWSASAIDESGWKNVAVPSLWDLAGLRDYDGFGWYRLTFRVPAEYLDRQLILLLGKIDDLDETYLNGERIGRTGRITSSMEFEDLGNSWTVLRAYTIPPGLLRSGSNTLAVRVYDGFLHGGIYEGPVGIVTRERFRDWQDAMGKGWDRFLNLFR